MAKSESEMRKIRGNRISMIFQEPMSSLNPVLTVGEQIAEAIRWYQSLSRAQAKSKAVEMLELVGVPAPATRINEYPHQLSGGMRQRVMIAMALACKPALLIADEPTTALDVTIQAQILGLMESLARDLGTSLLLITHDFGVIAEVCDQVAVMYAGSIVECASTKVLFSDPAILTPKPCSTQFPGSTSMLSDWRLLRAPSPVRPVSLRAAGFTLAVQLRRRFAVNKNRGRSRLSRDIGCVVGRLRDRVRHDAGIAT
jgi:ABC-type microcin C transport system duplicated ATPase subunit YejF